MDNREEAIRILEEAKVKLKKGWCQGAFALNEWGETVSSRSPMAHRWCLMGAIESSANKAVSGSAVMTTVMEVTGIGGLARFNDAPGRTQAEVIEVLDRAIARFHSSVSDQ